MPEILKIILNWGIPVILTRNYRFYLQRITRKQKIKSSNEGKYAFFNKKPNSK